MGLWIHWSRFAAAKTVQWSVVDQNKPTGLNGKITTYGGWPSMTATLLCQFACHRFPPEKLTY